VYRDMGHFCTLSNPKRGAAFLDGPKNEAIL